jgi:hypothetical protein
MNLDLSGSGHVNNQFFAGSEGVGNFARFFTQQNPLQIQRDPAGKAGENIRV